MSVSEASPLKTHAVEPSGLRCKPWAGIPTGTVFTIVLVVASTRATVWSFSIVKTTIPLVGGIVVAVAAPNGWGSIRGGRWIGRNVCSAGVGPVAYGWGGDCRAVEAGS